MATPQPVQNLRRAQAQYVRNQRERASMVAKLRRDIKKTMLVVFIAAVSVAAIADILSFLDVHWLESWIIPLICWSMARRISRINRAGDQIVAANTAARRQLQVVRQRLRPALLATGNARMLTGSTVSDLVWRGRSYISTFLRDTAITQLVELIPIVDWLPFFIGQVVKLYIDQNIAYQKVKKLLPRLEHTLQWVDRLERFEIEYLARVLALAIQSQSRNRETPQAVQPRHEAVPASARALPLRPAFASP